MKMQFMIQQNIQVFDSQLQRREMKSSGAQPRPLIKFLNMVIESISKENCNSHELRSIMKCPSVKNRAVCRMLDNVHQSNVNNLAKESRCV